MQNDELPAEKAYEPTEEKHLPVESTATMKRADSTATMANKRIIKMITFEESIEAQAVSNSQVSSCSSDGDGDGDTASDGLVLYKGNTEEILRHGELCIHPLSTYKDSMSQPPPNLDQRQRLLWLQRRRKVGLWVQCDDCDKWRHMPDVLDRHELPDTWYCRMNPDGSMASCSIAETPICVRDEQDLIHSDYSAGSLVWARLPPWPWWPAMVDDCPDTEQYYWLDGLSDIPTYYNVVFFDGDEVSRHWMTPEQLKPYVDNKKKFENQVSGFKKRLQASMAQADDAASLPVAARLKKYSFVSRYSGPISAPKITKDLIAKQTKILERKFNISFLPYDSDESEQEPLLQKRPRRAETVNSATAVIDLDDELAGIEKFIADKPPTSREVTTPTSDDFDF